MPYETAASPCAANDILYTGILVLPQRWPTMGHPELGTPHAAAAALRAKEQPVPNPTHHAGDSMHNAMVMDGG